MSTKQDQEATLISHLEALRRALIRSLVALAVGIVPLFLVSLALWLSLAFGSMFQFPLVTYALIRGGIVSYETVCDKRPYVVVGILAVAALLTPPDVVSQLILGAPTYLLFEAGLFAARRFKRKTR